VSLLERLDRARHRIPFWWWLTYDALVALVIVFGVRPWSFAFWLGFGVLAIAVAIDTVEFIVKRPAARARLDRSRVVRVNLSPSDRTPIIGGDADVPRVSPDTSYLRSPKAPERRPPLQRPR
jgi:hypothetical protein